MTLFLSFGSALRQFSDLRYRPLEKTGFSWENGVKTVLAPYIYELTGQEQFALEEPSEIHTTKFAIAPLNP
jgi:hypothetical protein